MKVVSLNCPNCNASIKIIEESQYVVCPACNSQLAFDDGKFHFVDEARIKEIDFEKQKYEDEKIKAQERNIKRDLWRKQLKIWAFAEGALFIFLCIIGCIYSLNSIKAILYIAYPLACIYALGIIIGPIYLSIKRPDADYEADQPPLIKNKILFGIVLFFIAYLMTSVIGQLFSGFLSLNN